MKLLTRSIRVLPIVGEPASSGSNKRYGAKKEDITIVKDDVIAHLMENDYANNEVSAEVLFNHMSDEFLDAIRSRHYGCQINN